MIFLDFRKAFDTVKNKILKLKLKGGGGRGGGGWSGMNARLLNWLEVNGKLSKA